MNDLEATHPYQHSWPISATIKAPLIENDDRFLKYVTFVNKKIFLSQKVSKESQIFKQRQILDTKNKIKNNQQNHRVTNKFQGSSERTRICLTNEFQKPTSFPISQTIQIILSLFMETTIQDEVLLQRTNMKVKSK